MNSLQDYFEQQNDKEAASIVADVVALLPSNTSVVNWKNQGDVEKLEKVEEMNENVVLNNILLTKEVGCCASIALTLLFNICFISLK